jgi:hypothetical protein
MNLVQSLPLLLLASISLRADVVIEQKTEGLTTGVTTMKVKGDRARVDTNGSAGNSTMLMDKTGKMVTYVHQSKLALVTTMTDAQKAAKELLKRAGAEPAKPDPFTNTGQSEKVGDWNCEVWIRHTPSASYKEWRSKDVPKRIQEQMAVLASAPGMGIDPAARGGAYTVKTERNEANGTTSTTITKISEEAIPDSDFTPPDGYRSMTVPAQ